MTVDLLETDSNAGSVSMDDRADECQQKWAAYIERFVSTDDDVPVAHTRELTNRQPVLLHRYMYTVSHHGHTIRSAMAENPMLYANFTTLSQSAR